VIIAAAALLFTAAASASDFEGLRVSALDGSTVDLQSLRGKKVTVVAFVSTKCPISHLYQDRLNRLFREYSAKGVGFAILNANDNESIGEIAKQAREAGFAFPVYKDYQNRVADFFEAQTTPEVYVLDSGGKVRYHGAIDDSSNPARVKVDGLRDAINAMVAGSEPTVKELKAFGCVLKRVKRTS
jgi:thiol-disulfide isomerase/thioredoxin